MVVQHYGSVRWDVANHSLNEAVESHTVADIEAILMCGADPETINEAMLTAVEMNRPEALAVLLAYGADIDTNDPDGGMTAVMQADFSGFTDCLRLLIQCDTTPHWGALVEAVLDGDTEGLEAMLPTHGTLRNSRNETALHWAARVGRPECVQSLLRHGADIDAQDTIGVTALIWACWKGHVGCVEALLPHGPNVDIEMNTGLTALMLAASDGGAECVEALLPYGPNLRIQAHTWGATALMQAARGAKLNTLQLLLAYGPELDFQDNRGKTAMQMIGECAWNVSVEHKEACVQLFQQFIPDQTVTACI